MNTKKIYFSNLTPLESFKISEEHDRSSFLDFLEEATDILATSRHDFNIHQVYVGFFYADILAVLLFELEGKVEEVSHFVWVVVGDLPPALIHSEKNPNAATALYSYVKEMGSWADAANRGESVAGLQPVKVTANPENAMRLQTRLNVLEEHILCNFKDEIIDPYLKFGCYGLAVAPNLASKE